MKTEACTQIPEIRKYASLQILRGLAAWTVVFHHYMQLYFGFKSQTLLGGFFSQYGAIGVDVFFVLSGFVMYLVAAKSNKGPIVFLADRIFRVAPLYWFYSLVTIICAFVFTNGFEFIAFNAKTLLASLMFLPTWNPSGIGAYPTLTVGWTLNFEMFFYLTLAVSMVITTRHVFKLLSLIFLLLPLTFPDSAYYSSIAASFLLYEFLAGIGLGLIWDSRSVRDIFNKHSRLTTVFAFLAVLLSIYILITQNLKIPVAVSIVFFALLCERNLQTNLAIVKALVRLGDESYSTYLAHVVVIGIAIHLTGKNLGQVAQFVTMLGICCGVFCISTVTNRFIERSRYLDRIRKRLNTLLGQTARDNDRSDDHKPLTRADQPLSSAIEQESKPGR